MRLTAEQIIEYNPDLKQYKVEKTNPFSIQKIYIKKNLGLGYSDEFPEANNS